VFCIKGEECRESNFLKKDNHVLNNKKETDSNPTSKTTLKTPPMSGTKSYNRELECSRARHRDTSPNFAAPTRHTSL